MKGPFVQSILSWPRRVAQLSPFQRVAFRLIGCFLGKATPLSAWFLYTLTGILSTINLQKPNSSLQLPFSKTQHFLSLHAVETDLKS